MDIVDQAQWEYEMTLTDNIVEYDPEDTRMNVEVMQLTDQAMKQLNELVGGLDIPLPPRPDEDE